MLSRAQIKVVSEICVGLGHLVVAATVLPVIFSDAAFRAGEALNAVSGLSAAMLFWIVSVLLIHE